MNQTRQLFDASAPQTYVYDATWGFWRREDVQGFAYSDGDEVEQRLLDAVRDVSDKSLFSLELAAHQIDWASTYHLSATRANLLRPLQRILSGRNVLEIGAGCGAITRYLGEIGSHVTALEGSDRRAAITAARCQDLEGVSVLCDRLDSAELTEKYDVVTLIGVLEYSRKYTAGEDPIQETLRRAYSLLKDDGILIVAIENQLGLKYFAGLNEDHLARPMAGIEDHYDSDGVVTFGKVELERHLHRAGFLHNEFALPFPDYKLPVSVVLPAGLKDANGFRASDIAAQAVRADRQLTDPTLFSMSQTFGVLGRNSLLADLSNSFLVLAGKSPRAPTFATAAPNVLATHYASSRHPAFTKSSEFVRDRDCIRVQRARLCPNSSAAPSLLIGQVVEDEIYHPGTHWGQALEGIVSRPGWTSDQIAQWLQTWLDALVSASGISARAPLDLNLEVPGKWFDATPRNLLIDQTTPRFFDLEWVARTPMSLGFLIFRGLTDALLSATRIARPAHPELAHIPTLIRATLRKLGIVITQGQIEAHYDAEASFQDETLGIIRQAPPRNSMDSYYLCISPEIGTMLRDGGAALASLSQLSAEVHSLRQAHDQAISDLNGSHQHAHQLEVRVGEVESSHAAAVAALEAAHQHELQLEAHVGAVLVAQTQALATCDELREELARARGRYSQEQQTCEVMRAQIAEKEGEIHRLWALIDEVRGTGRQFEQLHDVANQRLEELHQALSSARATEVLAAQLTSRLMQIESSRSWHLTAPLRAAAESLRRLIRLIRRLAFAVIRRAYHAVPKRHALRVKNFIFRSTGGVFANTNAYRRWEADRRLRAPEPRDFPTHASPPLQSIAPAQELWVADGHREWSDYAVVRDHIAAEFARVRDAVKTPRTRRMIELVGKDLEKAARSIRLPDPSNAPVVTILVPAFNHIATTLECLSSIADNADPDGPLFEVIVADDASTDDTAKVLAGISNLRVVSQPANLGFLLNCNAAAEHARGELLLLLNNDVQVTQGWLSALVDCFRSAPDIGAVGPRIVYPSGWLQEAGTRLRRDGTSEMIGLNDDPESQRFSYTRDVDYCSGACLLLRTSDFSAMGGFDTRYVPAYCEDSDLCMRLREAGGRIVYCAESTVIHRLSVTSDAMKSDYKLSCIAANVERFTQRWQSDLDRLDDVRTIAFYLPQFHPIPENDHWWAPGFTEWTNVSKAKPNFVGHYQPRMPAELGYYDLRLTEVMEQQAELARRYGIGGFCFYYYWFAGKRLLERPIEQMLETGRPDFPFCLCWANENWTRRWDGNERDVLMAQHHSDEDDEAVIQDLMRYFRSENYIRIHGKPLILVYRITLFPNFARTARLWRQACRDAGIGEIYIAQVESFELATAGIKPSDMGCDAAVEFPPQGMADPKELSSPVLNPDFNGVVADYLELAVRYATREFPAYKRFMGTMPGWDNTARRQNNSYCFENATPGAFQAWLETSIARTKQQYSGDERLVFINAWNEWAEGAYLEPDRRFGHAFLQAHSNAKEAGLLVRNGKYSLG